MHWRNTHDNWGWVAILIHWVTALAVVGLFALGLWMVELGYYDAWYQQAPHIHKSLGLLLLGVSLFRLGWRMFNRNPEPLASHTVFECKAALMTHRTLYLLLITVMVSGYLISTADGRAIEVFNWFAVPATLHGIDQQEDIAGTAHMVLAFVLVGLSTLHALAAVKHHFIDKDNTLTRMTGLSD